jgi:hypothetical protein
VTNKRLAALSLLASLAAASSWSQERPAPAALDVTSFGIVTLAVGQTARVNVVYAAVADPRLPPNPCVQDPRLPPNPCVVHITFRDGSGAVVASTTETLAPGQAASLEIGDGVLGGRTANRGVWAQVAVETTARRPRVLRLPPGPCIATLELVDDAGRTVLLHPGTTLRQSVADDGR